MLVALGEEELGLMDPFYRNSSETERGPSKDTQHNRTPFWKDSLLPSQVESSLGEKKDISCMFHKPASFGFIN